jgi:hypothetical protein
MSYDKYHQMETYLLKEVGPKFRESGQLSTFDFFTIIAWKSNRSKSKVARCLLKRYKRLGNAVNRIAHDISHSPDDRERMRVLQEDWSLKLPIASAILTVLYPSRFTIYDIRVCDSLNRFHKLKNKVFRNQWDGYLEFVAAVRREAPQGLHLRTKDRWLWGMSFHDQPTKDVNRKFGVTR